MLRRDGFASMDASGKAGTLTTRPLTFEGKNLFINVDCPEGELKVEVLDENHNVIEPFTLDHCEPVSVDRTLVQVNWEESKDLAALAGKPVRFRFHLTNGSLYAFWVSPDASGAAATATWVPADLGIRVQQTRWEGYSPRICPSWRKTAEWPARPSKSKRPPCRTRFPIPG